MITQKPTRNISSQPTSPDATKLFDPNTAPSRSDSEKSAVLTSANESSSHRFLPPASKNDTLNKRLIELVSEGARQTLSEFISMHPDELDFNYVNSMGSCALVVAFQRNDNGIAERLISEGSMIINDRMEKKLDYFVNKHNNPSLTAVFKSLQEKGKLVNSSAVPPTDPEEPSSQYSL